MIIRLRSQILDPASMTPPSAGSLGFDLVVFIPEEDGEERLRAMGELLGSGANGMPAAPASPKPGPSHGGIARSFVPLMVTNSMDGLSRR
jgi:hypothetical protein